MRENQRGKKAAAICMGAILMVGITACSGKEETPKIKSIVTDIQDEEDQVSILETDTMEESQDHQKNDDESAEELFSNANLTGSVVKISDSELSLSAATVGEDGKTLVEAAEGMENEEELIHITGQEAEVSILTMDRASQSKVSLSDLEWSEIKAQDRVLIFGECQDTYHWAANKIVIIKWQ